jgi:hypothetical protein
MHYRYDRDHDVLHLYFGSPTISYGDEPSPGIFIKYADSDDSVTGAVILDFRKSDPALINKYLPIKLKINEIKRDLLIK